MTGSLYRWMGGCVLAIALAGCAGGPNQIPKDYVPHQFGEPVSYQTTYFFDRDGKRFFFASEEELKAAMTRPAGPTSLPSLP